MFSSAAERKVLGRYRVICPRAMGQFKYLNAGMIYIESQGGMLQNRAKEGENVLI